MRDGHAEGEALITVRPPAQLKLDAQAILKARGLDMRAYFVACLAALVDDADRRLAEVQQYWPPDKPRGRPRRTDRTQ